MSRLFTFSEGSNEARIQCYLHTTDYAARSIMLLPVVIDTPAERKVILSKAYRA